MYTTNAKGMLLRSCPPQLGDNQMMSSADYSSIFYPQILASTLFQAFVLRNKMAVPFIPLLPSSLASFLLKLNGLFRGLLLPEKFRGRLDKNGMGINVITAAIC